MWIGGPVKGTAFWEAYKRHPEEIREGLGGKYDMSGNAFWEALKTRSKRI